jgi:hypothetical protein
MLFGRQFPSSVPAFLLRFASQKRASLRSGRKEVEKSDDRKPTYLILKTNINFSLIKS